MGDGMINKDGRTDMTKVIRSFGKYVRRLKKGLSLILVSVICYSFMYSFINKGCHGSKWSVYGNPERSLQDYA